MTKTLPKLKKEAEKYVNAYVRKRDAELPCISCGKHKVLQAGHYYPVKGYDGLRFNTDNIHGECAGCNCFDESHLIHYTKNIKDRIGLERFEELEKAAADYKMNGYKYTRSELTEIIEKYKKL